VREIVVVKGASTGRGVRVRFYVPSSVQDRPSSVTRWSPLSSNTAHVLYARGLFSLPPFPFFLFFYGPARDSLVSWRETIVLPRSRSRVRDPRPLSESSFSRIAAEIGPQPEALDCERALIRSLVKDTSRNRARATNGELPSSATRLNDQFLTHCVRRSYGSDGQTEVGGSRRVAATLFRREQMRENTGMRKRSERVLTRFDFARTYPLAAQIIRHVN